MHQNHEQNEKTGLMNGKIKEGVTFGMKLEDLVKTIAGNLRNNHISQYFL